MNIEITEKNQEKKQNNHTDEITDNNIDEFTKEVGINTNVNTIVRSQENYKNTLDNNNNNFFYKFCMIVNLMIISATLLILIYYLYQLTNKIGNINFNAITLGIESVNQNLNNINFLGSEITHFIKHFEDSEISELSVKKINYLTDQLSQANFQDLNIDRFYQLFDVLNQTLYNFNNVITQFQSPFLNTNFDPSFSPVFNPAFNPAFNPEFNPNLNELESDQISAQAAQAAETAETSEFAQSAETSEVSQTAQSAQSANPQSATTQNLPTPSTGSSSGITPFRN